MFQSDCKQFLCMISQASCCLNKSKPFFPDLTLMFCKQGKNWDGSRADFLDLSIGIVLTKDDTNGERVSVCKEMLVHNSTIELKLCSEALM